MVDTLYAREIALWTTNCGDIYTSRTAPYIKALAAKIVVGKYDAGKALIGWKRIAREGAATYAKEYGCPIVPKAVSDYAAVEIAEYYDEQLQETAAAVARDKKLLQIWTMSAIRNAVIASGSPRFDAKTMKFFRGNHAELFATR